MWWYLPIIQVIAEEEASLGNSLRLFQKERERERRRDGGRGRERMCETENARGRM